jgi:hypothetical protein
MDMEQPEKFDTDYLIIGSGSGADAAVNRLGQLSVFDTAWSEPLQGSFSYRSVVHLFPPGKPLYKQRALQYYSAQSIVASSGHHP